MSVEVEHSKSSQSDVEPSLDSIQLNDGEETEDDNELALRGVQLLLNNKMDESAALFEKYKSHSVIMHYGGAFINYMQGRPNAFIV